jgi:DNA-binding MarR family transcriptional regulator
MPSEDVAEAIPIPALLRAARGAYGNAVRARLAAADYDDMPGNGPYVLGGLAANVATAGELIRQLGVTKQAASQLIDTLVVRGYLARRADPDDRRRMLIELTDRGRAAAGVVGAAVEAVDAELAQLLTPVERAGLVAGLVALTEIRERMEAGARTPAAEQ